MFTLLLRTSHSPCVWSSTSFFWDWFPDHVQTLLSIFCSLDNVSSHPRNVYSILYAFSILTPSSSLIALLKMNSECTLKDAGDRMQPSRSPFLMDTSSDWTPSHRITAVWFEVSYMFPDTSVSQSFHHGLVQSRIRFQILIIVHWESKKLEPWEVAECKGSSYVKN